MTQAPAPDRPRPRIPGVSVFFTILALVFAAYTLFAFQLEWETQAGRIGAGFFPRIIGSAGLVLSAGVALWTLRTHGKQRADAAQVPTYLRVTALLTGAGVLFVVLLVPVGALLATAVFVFAVLWVLDRSRLVRNAVISVGTSVALYLLLEVALNAGLPEGPFSVL